MKEEYRRIAVATNSEAGLLILDTREEQVMLRLYAWRHWIRGGIHSRDIRSVSPIDISIAEEIDEHTSIPLAVIVTFANREWALASEMMSCSETRLVVQIVDHGGGQLRLNSEPLPYPPKVDGTGSTRLTVVAGNRVVAHRADLPRRLKFRTGALGGAENLVFVKAESQRESSTTRLPEPAWLRIDSPVPVLESTLHIEITPRNGRDQWHFRVEPDGAKFCFAHPPEPRNALSRVALVVDRTCPDVNHWAEALQLAQERHEKPSLHPGFNEDVRRALQEVVTRYPWPGGSRGRLSWFADVPDEGVASLKGVASTKAWDVRLPDSQLPGGFGTAVNEMTYYPGFDVWDPVDECILSASDYFADGLGGTLIIIGNSPPSFNPEDKSIAGIATALGFPTISRRRRSRWREALEKLAHLGVRVFYVFLRLTYDGGAEVDSFGAFDTLQSRIEMALGESLGGNTLSVIADFEGVRGGLTEALNRAQEQGTFSSGVILHDFL